jgi:glycosyltransferase involved in cell wall biosynthesis
VAPEHSVTRAGRPNICRVLPTITRPLAKLRRRNTSTATTVREATLQVNGAFIGQKITGQQRYAHEIMSALLRGQARRVNVASPPQKAQRSRLAAWAWVQALGLRSGFSPLLSLTSRAPVVALNHWVVIHDLFLLDNPEWFGRSFRLTHAPLLRLQLLMARRLIAVSEPVAAQLRVRVKRPGRVFCVPNAPSKVFSEAPLPDRARETLQKYRIYDKPFFLVAGSDDPRKNVRDLLNAWAALSSDERNQHIIVLAGASHAAFANSNVRTDAASVRHVGYVSDEELAVLYSSAHAVIFVTLAEGFGLPAVEALSAGANLLLSDIPVLRWAIGPHAHYVDPRNQSSLLEGLRAALSWTAPTEQERAHRRRAIGDRFDWARSADTLATEVWPGRGATATRTVGQGSL